MNEGAGGAAEGALRELREQFAQRLPARLDEIEQAWQRARAAGWEPEPLRLSYRLAHSLSGAAATFGFPEVAAVALRLETRLRELLAARTAPGAETAGPVADLLAELRRTVQPPSPPAA